MRNYVDTVLRELAATRRMGGGPLQTVFFGGGVRRRVITNYLSEHIVHGMLRGVIRRAAAPAHQSASSFGAAGGAAGMRQAGFGPAASSCALD